MRFHDKNLQKLLFDVINVRRITSTYVHNHMLLVEWVSLPCSVDVRSWELKTLVCTYRVVPYLLHKLGVLSFPFNDVKNYLYTYMYNKRFIFLIKINFLLLLNVNLKRQSHEIAWIGIFAPLVPYFNHFLQLFPEKFQGLYDFPQGISPRNNFRAEMDVLQNFSRGYLRVNVLLGTVPWEFWGNI